MCNNKSCTCQIEDLAALEELFCEVWADAFTVREEAEIEYRATH